MNFTREDFLHDLDYTVVETDAGIATRSFLQYDSFVELYRSFGELCPQDEHEFELDLYARCKNWRRRLKKGEV